MLVTIKEVLNFEQLHIIRKLLKNADFVDGKLSVGREAKAVKNNQELAAENPYMQQLNHLVMPTLLENAEFQTAALPQRVATPFYARYTKGMQYGTHVDDPVMGPMGQNYRTDVSATVFLNEPSEYAGGELVIQTEFGEQTVKMNAGDVVVYPSSSLHRVNEITDGTRLVAVVWAQSLVRDAQKRSVLRELSDVRDRLHTNPELKDDVRHLSNVYSNLMRQWVEI
ncbi:MAG: Iron-uptake factor PiuC [uncultured Thiotrichaceae bacterium]|uniref:Iron-uptake factor PiuC n=1 Tax=uncultured Thiotrichaceae bacterium TaxID=298394 RepID=A0A6S6SRK0_9GAMM|nr:MAG: Iron-uptake factor PiuC [uncultured Thiotrichaceae bacterium]